MTSRLQRAATLGIAAGLLGVAASLVPRVLELEENAGLSWLFALRGPAPPPADVAVVSIDAESAAALGVPSAPDRWPRSLHADLVDRLARAGAAAVVFDIIFDRARRSADDARFAAALERAGNVILLERLRSETIPVGVAGAAAVVDKRVPPIPPLKRAAIATAPFPLPVVPVKVGQFWTFGRGTGGAPTLPSVALQAYALPAYDALVERLYRLRPALRGALPEHCAELRDARPLERVVAKLRGIFRADPSLAGEMLTALDGESPPGAPPEAAARTAMLRALIDLYGGGDSRYLDYYGPQRSILTVPYHEVLQLMPGDELSRALRGRVVFVGFSERQQPEQRDDFYSTFSERSGLNLGGVEIAATAFANLSHGRAVEPLTIPAHLALALGWGALLGAAFTVLPTMLSIGAAAVLGSLYLALAAQLFGASGTWLPLIVPLFVQVPAALFAAVLWSYARARNQAQRIQRAIGYYLPARVVDRLARETVDARSSAQLLHGTCLVTDAEQYTALAERIAPAELRELMNDYYAVLFKDVERHGGFVSDIVGDSMVAVWASAEPDAVARASACRAALEMLADIEPFNRAKVHRELPTRIGLHSGEVLLGSVGAERHFEYRAIGDIVNTASRIQALNKRLGTRLLVSAATLEGTAGFAVRPLGRFLLAGKTAAESVCELTGPDAGRNGELAAGFAEALAAFAAEHWAEAARRFEDLGRQFPADGPTRFYRELSARYRREGPGPAWRGAVPVSSK
jgi:adenylate cyclase